MQRREDEEFESTSAPDEVTDNREYIDNLRASGDGRGSQPSFGKSLKPDMRIYPLSLNVKVLRDTFEVTTALKSQDELQRLESLIIKYFQSFHFKGAKIEFLTDTNPTLLNELKKFCVSYKEEHLIPFGIRLVYRGKAA